MFIVTLPRGMNPLFPHKCIRCSVTEPLTKARFIHFNGYRLFTVYIPVCQECNPWILAWLVWDNLRTIFIAGSAFAFGLFILLPRLPGWATGLIVLGICASGFFAVFLWNRIHPPSFNVDPRQSNVDYEFGDDNIGHEFAILNGASDPDSSA